MVKLIFKTNKKTDKHFFTNHYLVNKNVNLTLSEKQRKTSKTSSWMVSKSFRREKIKKQKHSCQEWLVKYRKSCSKEIQKLKLVDSFIDSTRSLHEV